MCHTHLIHLPWEEGGVYVPHPPDPSPLVIHLPWEEGGVYVPHPPDPALCDVEVPAGTAPLSGERDHTLRITQIITTLQADYKQSNFFQQNLDKCCPLNLLCLALSLDFQGFFRFFVQCLV
jgi:hypothetical protein